MSEQSWKEHHQIAVKYPRISFVDGLNVFNMSLEATACRIK